MAGISVGDAIGEGFSLIRRAPGSVLLWGLAQLSFTVIIFALYMPIYVDIFQAARSGEGASALQTMSPQMTQLQGLSYLIDVLQLGVISVVYCAVWRAVLHPERSQFAYLRLGMAELFVGALLFGGYFAFALGFIFAALIVAIVIAILVAVHVIWAAVTVGVVAAIAAIGAIFYLVLRLALVGPMIVDDGQFHFPEAWALTKNQVGSLFLIGLVLVAIILIGEILIGIVLFAIGAGALIGIAGGAQNLPTFFQQSPGTLIARLGPLLVIAAAIWTPFVGALLAIMGAPWARAYRDLKPTDVSATFA